MYIQGRCLCRVGMFSPWLHGFSPWTGFLPHSKDVQLGEVACLHCPSLDLSECECGCGDVAVVPGSVGWSVLSSQGLVSVRVCIHQSWGPGGS